MKLKRAHQHSDKLIDPLFCIISKSTRDRRTDVCADQWETSRDVSEQVSNFLQLHFGGTSDSFLSIRVILIQVHARTSHADPKALHKWSQIKFVEGNFWMEHRNWEASPCLISQWKTLTSFKSGLENLHKSCFQKGRREPEPGEEGTRGGLSFLTGAEATGQTAECDGPADGPSRQKSCRHTEDVRREKYLSCADKSKSIHTNQLTWLRLSELLSRRTKENPKEPPGFLSDNFLLLEDTGIFSTQLH